MQIGLGPIGLSLLAIERAVRCGVLLHDVRVPPASMAAAAANTPIATTSMDSILRSSATDASGAAHAASTSSLAPAPTARPSGRGSAQRAL